MKNIAKLVILCLSFSLLSCEEVVDIELETVDPHLVINAPLEWKKGTDGSYQSIELTTTTGFYENSPPKVSGAFVNVTNSSGKIFLFEEGESAGIYECFDFEPELFEEYELEVILDFETYIATEVLYPVPNFDYTEQMPPALGDIIEIKAFFTDPENEENFYLIQETSSTTVVPGNHVFNDQFFNGNQNYASYNDEALEPQDFVKLKLFGISSRHHDYLYKIITSYQGGPFQTVPGLIRGNIQNITNPQNFAFGYFSLSETSTITHIVH